MSDAEALNIQLASEYLDGALTLTAIMAPELKELNYLKNDIRTPDGGIYVLALLHVSGPKINLEEIREMMKAAPEGEE